MIEKQKMSSMDYDSPIAEPPRKISKTTSSCNSPKSSPNVLQKIKHTIALDASEKKPKSQLLYHEVKRQPYHFLSWWQRICGGQCTSTWNLSVATPAHTLCAILG